MTGQPPARPDDWGALVAAAVERQKKFERARATRLGQGAERMTAPIGGWIARMIPPEAVRAALHQADRAAAMTLPRGIAAHDTDDLAQCEAAALRVQAWGQGTSAATGGAAGWFGAAGLAVDLPATLTLAARTVRATGGSFGFTEDSDNERAFRLMVLEVATSLASDTRAERLNDLNALARQLSSPEAKFMLEKGGRWLTEKVFERIARQLGLSLAARKAGQVVPIVGGLVAATVNASFQADVARAARYAYRQRWLLERKALPGPEPEKTA
ncbi:EcsC family protein [Anianabacter salinae]|uniref:EcsC family protein n=1 Tax=Anianabacter salinae TaxID=2851023 RepID=UPI00225DE6B4|nr:EcsC family protein [Anianabacter salinae]MBV0911417.1 EcsC family protein [Anianabacter salinae]